MPNSTYYLDNAATTQPIPQVIQAVTGAMESAFGNPSSLHHLGVEATRLLSGARESAAALFGCDTDCIFFTSGASEANNTAIFGSAGTRKQRHAVVSAVEHSSVSIPFAQLSAGGWEVTVVPPNPDGTLDASRFLKAVRPDTALVSLMMVNNETGAIFPVEEVASGAKAIAPRTLVHCDGVQAFGKLPLKVKRLEIDFMSVSGHKFCAPKGIGALYIRKGIHIPPLIYGGGQERGMRSGTESVPLIAGFGAACGVLVGKEQENMRKVQKLRDHLTTLLQGIPSVVLLSPNESSPYIVNFSVPGYHGETMLHFLESKGIYVSSGSACAKGAGSTVLEGMHLPKKVLEGALRASFIYHTPENAVDQLILALKEGLAEIAHT